MIEPIETFVGEKYQLWQMSTKEKGEITHKYLTDVNRIERNLSNKMKSL